MSKLADDLCAEVRNQCEQAEHFKNLWIQANEELHLHREGMLVWEKTMMAAIGEDGVGDVAKAINALKDLNLRLVNSLEETANELAQLHAQHYAPCESGCPATTYIKTARTLIAEARNPKPPPAIFDVILDAAVAVFRAAGAIKQERSPSASGSQTASQ